MVDNWKSEVNFMKWFSPSFFMEVTGVELRLPCLSSKLFPMSYLTGLALTIFRNNFKFGLVRWLTGKVLAEQAW